MKANKTKVTRLLKTARGQIDGILKMIDDDRYCIDIYNQILATSSILKATNKEIIKAHIENCIKQAFEDNDKNEKLNEVLSILDKLS